MMDAPTESTAIAAAHLRMPGSLWQKSAQAEGLLHQAAFACGERSFWSEVTIATGC
jgi:hypothetical protein